MIYKFQPILKTLVWGTENWVLSGVKGNRELGAVRREGQRNQGGRRA